MGREGGLQGNPPGLGAEENLFNQAKAYACQTVLPAPEKPVAAGVVGNRG